MLSFSRKGTTTIQIGFVLLLISLVTYWGGTARPGPLFAAGVVLLTGLLLALGLVIWWLFFSPLPIPEAAHPRIRPQTWWARQIIVIAMIVSGLLFSSGAVWDEVWHRKLRSFGNDFLWPPHLLIYISLALIALVAAVGVLMLVRGGGDIRQRFRREPLIGFLAVVATYLVVSLPSDQIWHAIYGKDLTAWSLPHTIMLIGITTTLLISVALQLSLLPQDSRNLAQEGSILLLISLATNAFMQFGTAEWESIIGIPTQTTNAFQSAFWNRPEWLHPVVVISVALFSGNFVLSTLRRAGAATFVALLVIGFRAAELSLFGGWEQRMGMTSYVLILPPMLALDFWYVARARQLEMFSTLLQGWLLAGGVGLLVGLPIIAQTMIYPRVNSATIPGMIGFSLIMAVIAGWAGVGTGRWIAAFSEQSRQEAQAPWSIASQNRAVS